MDIREELFVKKLSYLCILTAGCLWGLNGLFFRFLSAYGFDQMQVTFVKTLISSAILFVVLLVKDPSLFKIRLKDCWIFLGGGLISMLFFNYCYYTSLVHTTVAVTVSLLYTGPGFVMLISAILFKEKITPRKLAALVVIFMGCACSAGLFAGSQQVTAAGILWGLMAGFTYGLYTIFSRLAQNRGYGTLTISFYVLLVCAVGVISFMDFDVFSIHMPLPAIGYCVAVAVFSCFLPYVLFTAGMKKLEAGEAAMLATSEPVMAAVASAVVLSESLSVFVVIGIVLIVSGIVLMNLKPQRKAARAH